MTEVFSMPDTSDLDAEIQSLRDSCRVARDRIVDLAASRQGRIDDALRGIPRVKVCYNGRDKFYPLCGFDDSSAWIRVSDTTRRIDRSTGDIEDSGGLRTDPGELSDAIHDWLLYRGGAR